MTNFYVPRSRREMLAYLNRYYNGLSRMPKKQLLAIYYKVRKNDILPNMPKMDLCSG